MKKWKKWKQKWKNPSAMATDKIFYRKNTQVGLKYPHKEETTRDHEFNSVESTLDYIHKEQISNAMHAENCSPNPSIAAQEFMATRNRFSARPGNEILHIIHSYSPEESKLMTIDLVLENAVDITRKAFPGHQFHAVVHTDKAHLHAHIVVNTVNDLDGSRIKNKKENLYKFRQISNEVCKSKGLSIIEPKSRNRIDKYAYSLDLKQKLRSAAELSTNFNEFMEILDPFGIKVRVGQKSISFRYPGHKPKRGDKLGKDFTLQNLTKTFSENKEKCHTVQHKEIKACFQHKYSDPQNFTSLNTELLFDFRKELNIASSKSILDYAKTHSFKIIHNKGKTYLKDMPFIELKDSKWINHKNNTNGNIIDFVAFTKDLTVPQAVALINNKPELAVIEKILTGKKFDFKSISLKKESKSELLKYLNNFISDKNNINHPSPQIDPLYINFIKKLKDHLLTQDLDEYKTKSPSIDI